MGLKGKSKARVSGYDSRDLGVSCAAAAAMKVNDSDGVDSLIVVDDNLPVGQRQETNVRFDII